jgi:hypothetical protein
MKKKKEETKQLSPISPEEDDLLDEFAERLAKLLWQTYMSAQKEKKSRAKFDASSLL